MEKKRKNYCGTNLMEWLCLKGVLSLIFILVNLFITSQVTAQNKKDSTPSFQIKYGNKGLELHTKEDKFLLQVQSRLQFRFATPSDQDPVSYEDYAKGNLRSFKINRARLKVGGHAFQPWLKYYWEYELGQGNLLDFRIMVEKWEWLKFKVGQWKIEYSRERFISSGEQQMMDRSIINRTFTVDRQQGIEVNGRLKIAGSADFSYWLAALTGTGMGSPVNDDARLMYFGRLQWNMFGRAVEFEGSDLEYHEKPAAIIAIAAVTNRSPYTRFSQAGGGSLEGFNSDSAGRYRVNQINLESAFVFKGFSWQSELHRKYITDKFDNNKQTALNGYYIQAGYFFHDIINWFPKQLEIAAREAVYRPDIDQRDNLQRETSLAINWFFNGHKNKLTSELNYFRYQDKTLPLGEGYRFRLQWDISL